MKKLLCALALVAGCARHAEKPTTPTNPTPAPARVRPAGPPVELPGLDGKEAAYQAFMGKLVWCNDIVERVIPEGDGWLVVCPAGTEYGWTDNFSFDDRKEVAGLRSGVAVTIEGVLVKVNDKIRRLEQCKVVPLDRAKELFKASSRK